MLTCNDPQLRELIHGYELDQLSETERERFEAHLFSCPFCLHEAQAMSRISSLAVSNRDELLSVLRGDGLTFDQIRRRLRTSPATIWNRMAEVFQGWQGRTALAGAAVMAVLLAFFLRPAPTASPYSPYLSYELPVYRTDIRVRGEMQDEATRRFESAMEFYASGNYAAASKGIKRSLKLDANQPDRWLFLGTAQFALRNPKAAIPSLQRAEQDGTGLTRTRARWYLAECYLLRGKVRPAEDLLEWLVANDAEYAVDARTLLAKVRELKP